MNTFGDYRLVSRFKCTNDYFNIETYKNLPQAALLVLLKGGFEVEKISLQKKIKQKIDYTGLGTEQINSKSVENYIHQITSRRPPDISATRNIPFYKSILVEACACLYAINTRQGIIAMLHCYRLLERIAFSMPLIYIQRTSDFKKSFDAIKSFFANSDKNSGELSFFKTSLNTIYEDFEKEYKLTYSITTKEMNALQHCFTSTTQIHSENQNEFKFELTLIQSIEALIKIRNSFFHALSGKAHISLENLTIPDSTFQKLTPNFILTVMFTIAKITEPNFIGNPTQ